MIPYASRTGSGRNLRALGKAKWRLLVSAAGVWRTEGFPYAIDNGAWTASELFKAGKRATPVPDLAAFQRLVALLGPGADFIVVPDIVQGGERSWLLTRYWLRKLRRNRRLRGVKLLIAVQDGFDPAMIAPYLSARVGVFVGGGTEWKLATMKQWIELAHARGAYAHVARVNSEKRARLCDIAGADSFDGSGPSRFEDSLRRVDRAFEQRDLEGAIRRAA